MQTEKILPLAIATVPMQPLGKLFDPARALRKGTVFENLDMPFFAADGLLDSPLTAGLGPAAGDVRQQEREEMMMKIYQVSFVLDDLILYLDTHPRDLEALACYEEKGKEREVLLKEFAQKFYPLTRDCMAGCGKASVEFMWNNGPAPWEGACI